MKEKGLSKGEYNSVIMVKKINASGIDQRHFLYYWDELLKICSETGSDSVY